MKNGRTVLVYFEIDIASKEMKNHKISNDNKTKRSSCSIHYHYTLMTLDPSAFNDVNFDLLGD